MLFWATAAGAHLEDRTEYSSGGQNRILIWRTEQNTHLEDRTEYGLIKNFTDFWCVHVSVWKGWSFV